MPIAVYTLLRLLMMDSKSETCRLVYKIKLRNSAPRWLLL